MLSRLHIENAAVIEKADLELDAGLNVLTGETGAGKSILIDSINLVLGERVSREIVRTGAHRALVSALFTGVSKTVQKAAEELGFACDEDASLLLQRDINTEGRGSVRINGRPATASLLRELGRLLVNTHGQHDNQALLSPERHVVYLDRYAGNTAELDAYAQAYDGLCRIRAELAKINTDEAEKARRTDLLTYQTEEIAAASLRIGEEDELRAQKLRFANAEKIAAAVGEAYSALGGGDDAAGACGLLETAADALERAQAFYPELGSIASRLRSAYFDADECLSDLRGYADDAAYDPQELENVELRLDAIYRLEHKYGADIEAVLQFYEKAQQELESITGSEERTEELQKELTISKRQVVALAAALSEKRHAAANEMQEKIRSELQFLDMPGVQFTVQFSSLAQPGPEGAERVEFLISANPGSPPKPLAKIASGGELSRIMLAIKNVLADNDEIETSIFDEIDTGVSGRAAQKIGLKLHEVAQGRQVICVTHLAQIAAQADRHILIEKQFLNNNTFTSLKTLDFEGRKHELARIIGGADITQLTLQNAEEMLLKAGAAH